MGARPANLNSYKNKRLVSNPLETTLQSKSPFASFITLKTSSWLLAMGLLLMGAGGAFLPWVWHSPVALQLTGPHLAEFVKFLPEIRTTQLQINRLYFLLPLFMAMLALPLLAENKALDLPIWLRWGLRLTVIPLALASLSPVWTPAILTAPEFKLQTGLALLAVGLAVIAPLFKHLPLKLLIPLLVVGTVVALLLAAQQFGRAQASISNVYNEPVFLGWGWYVTVWGGVFSTVGGIWAAFGKKN